uniref:Uncharacterized protein n=1 Tax=Rhizophora mucronata TaxID=61149 RepID=A0A2P2PRJ7_RHIMU
MPQCLIKSYQYLQIPNLIK